MADPVATHKCTVLGIVSQPSDLGPNRHNLNSYPLELEYAGVPKTTLLMDQSNLAPSNNGSTTTQEFIHLTGIRYGTTSLQHGYLTLDSRAPAIGPGSHVNNESGEEPMIFALSEDTYLVYRWSGRVTFDWQCVTTKAWIIRVNDVGTPVVVDELMCFAPGSYNPYRNEFILIAPGRSWVLNEAGFPAGFFDEEILSHAGCYGFSVSLSGFGNRVNYPDPSYAYYESSAHMDISDFPHPGIGTNSLTMPVSYYTFNQVNGAYSHVAYYYIDSGTMSPELAHVGDTQPLLGSPIGDKGDIIAGQDKFLGWTWGNGQYIQMSPTAITRLEPTWDYFGNDFVHDTDLSIDQANRSVFNGVERRWAISPRYTYTPYDPPFTTLQDAYDRHPAYKNFFTYDEFVAAVNAQYPDPNVFLAIASQGDPAPAGYWVGFQGANPTAATTYWGIWESELQNNPVTRILGVDVANNVYYTASEQLYSGGSVHIARWDPIVVVPDPDPDPPVTTAAKRPVRMYPRKDSRAFQGFR